MTSLGIVYMDFIPTGLKIKGKSITMKVTREIDNKFNCAQAYFQIILVMYRALYSHIRPFKV